MADDAENPDPSAAASTEQQAQAGPAPSQTTQATYATVRTRRGSQGMTKLIGKDDLKDVKKLLIMTSAEFLGTFFLVFLGVTACIRICPSDYATLESTLPPVARELAKSKPPGRSAAAVSARLLSARKGPGSSDVCSMPVKIILVALVFGLAVATIAQMLGHVSGAHLNPAVSFGLVAAGECGLIKAGIYFLAQLFGAIFGALAVHLSIMPRIPEKIEGEAASAFRHPFQITDSLSNTKIAEWQALFIEMIITFPLIFVILAVCDKGNNMKGSAALAIGLAIALGHLVGIQPTGSSMNPVRSMGPLIVNLAFGDRDKPYNQPPPPPPPPGEKKVPTTLERSTEQIWIYLIGPILGGVFAGLLYRFVYNFEKQGITNDKKEGEDKQ